ncbi:Metallo-beta-lactamase domain protein [Meloidogyne graminicola]|uniref:Beta-lactamase-like protein 2 homolog n=1 Tax=Meloidogyne graminicola TaxID=189291 RepID=A0A8S9ZQB3_9BILA|nr:Metallo-beta-lactamase domain protein [Meloidogyne graminicola]
MITRKLQSKENIPSGLTSLEDVTQITPLVQRILGQNPGAFTLQGTNTYLVGNGTKKILIDAGEPNVSLYLNKLIDALNNNSSSLEAIVLTHWHSDHIGGNIPIYKHRRTDNQNESSELNFTFVEDGHKIKVEGATLRFLFTPGHTSDHSSLWLEEEGTLFSGDCILGEGSAVFENLNDYMKSLQRLLDLSPKRIYPGHGPVVEDPKRKIIEYIDNRNRREKEILEIISNDGPATTMQITNAIYKDILPSKRIGALMNVRHHLFKLLSEGKIKDIGPSVGGVGFGLYRIVEENELNKNKL